MCTCYRASRAQKLTDYIDLHQVAVVSEHLGHPYIISLPGVVTEPLQPISECPMETSDTLQRTLCRQAFARVFLPSQHASRRPSQLSDAAEGLNHLHSCNLIQGDPGGVCGYSVSHSTATLTVTPVGQTSFWTRSAMRRSQLSLAAVTRDLDSPWNAPAKHGHGTR